MPLNIVLRKSTLLKWGTALILLAASISWILRPSAPQIPARFLGDLPAGCQQVLLVKTAEATATVGRLWLMEQAGAGSDWHAVGGPIPVTVGRSGLAWGDGEHGCQVPDGLPSKKEGDGCSPAGIFALPFAFGSEAAPGQVGIPYQQMTVHSMGVDDPASQYYNQVVDDTVVKPDWNSRETMLREDGLYGWGAFIAHNPRQKPGGGSCIFLHLWSGPGRPTAGCTAMAEADLRRVLAWLQAAREPRLVQGLDAW
jgi:L,D-peptidoglycan transpeptidase YkuD (ErfK/YbiS/YcfS/YnhG family)